MLMGNSLAIVETCCSPYFQRFAVTFVETKRHQSFRLCFIYIGLKNIRKLTFSKSQKVDKTQILLETLKIQDAKLTRGKAYF